MRLTIINQFYAPDLAPTGKLAASLAEHRARYGDEVSIITSAGGYVPQSRVAAVSGGDNPHVHRLWTPRAGKASALGRLADYAIFALQAGLRMLTLPGQDVIIALTTPPFIAWAAILHRLLHQKTVLVLWNMDSYPEILERTGVVRQGDFFSRFLRWLNRRLFSQLTAVVALDQAMLHLLRTTYGPLKDGPIWQVIPNWEPAEKFPANLTPGTWQEAEPLGLEDRFVVLYTGNAGFGHDFETVLAAAGRLRADFISWLFVGGGQKYVWLKEQLTVRRLDQVHLMDYVASDEVPSVLASAGCALITMNENALGVISPSKLHASLAMGLPILYVGPAGGNVDEAIQRFGVGVSLRHDDVDGIVDFLRKIAQEREFRRALGRNARTAFEQAYCDKQTLPQFDELIATIGRAHQS